MIRRIQDAGVRSIGSSPRSSRLQSLTLTALILVGAVAFTSAAASKAPSIEQIMGAPYPFDLTAAPRGGAVAWVVATRGVRNVWVANSADKIAAHAITNFTEDDGNDIGEITWSTDASKIAFTRGASIEERRATNVDSAPGGADQPKVWVASADGSGAREVGVGHSATISPRGESLIYVEKGNILSAALAGGTSKVILADSGKVQSLTWSPDGERLAFVSDRGSHAIVGVYDLASELITWLSPSLDHDADPTFGPDGQSVAFIRTAASDQPAFVSEVSGAPWSIWVADVRTGEGRRVWLADRGQGSLFQPTLSEKNLIWSADNRLIFPWEKTGWLQLYSVPADGGSTTALTSGAYEIAALALGSDHRSVYYASNQNDNDRSHIWVVGGAHQFPAALATGDSIEAYPAIAADGSVYALQSGAREPLHPVILRGAAWAPLAPNSSPEHFPSEDLVTPRSVTFTAKDGQTVHGQIFVPAGAERGARPAILFFHGGPRRQMLLGFHYMGAYNWMYAQNQYLASHGYIVLSVNYRGGIGYGLRYREAPGFGPGGGSEVNDILGAIDFLRSRKDVDATRLGVWGASYGGLMTALTLARASDAVAAGVDYAGVYDWSTMLSATGVPTIGPEATRLAIQSSPIATIDRWKSPVLIVQADDDHAVPSSQATQLILALRKHDIQHDQLMLPNEVHDLARFKSWIQLFHASARYFDEHLGGSAARR